MTFVLIKTTDLTQSKLANLVYAAKIARRYPALMSVCIHPGLVQTEGYENIPFIYKHAGVLFNYLTGVRQVSPETGALNQLWASAGAERSALVNGGFYYPVGVLYNAQLDKVATSTEFAKRLWDWTEDALDGTLS